MAVFPRHASKLLWRQLPGDDLEGVCTLFFPSGVCNNLHDNGSGYLIDEVRRRRAWPPYRTVGRNIASESNHKGLLFDHSEKVLEVTTRSIRSVMEHSNESRP